MRYFIEVAYNGKNYHGWQIQKNAGSIQQVITECLSTKLRSDISITGSGRTDTGVHARSQVFHLDSVKQLDSSQFIEDINTFLPSDITIKSVRQVKVESHARFDAFRRSYEYLLIQSRDPFLQDFAYFRYGDLDFKAMNTAAQFLLGIHDFQSFSKVKTDVKNFECEVFNAKWYQKDNVSIFKISANRFLRGMVRAIVGTLLIIGTGKQKPVHLEKVMLAKSRNRAGHAVPPAGLYLSEVLYPESLFEV